MSAARTLSLNTLDKIQQRFNMEEIGSPYKTLSSQMGEVGQLRLFKGDAVQKMVYISMTVDAFGLDSHMIFAFTAPESPVPHFTLDSVKSGDHFAFHLDLIPRMDLGANLDYIMEAFSPLDEIYTESSKIEGLTPARLAQSQYALMSPWMLVYRATAEAFAAIETPKDQYLEHWFGLVENGVSSNGYSGEELAVRDRRNRDAIFNPKVDKVWAQVDRLLGAETSAEMQAILKNQAVEG